MGLYSSEIRVKFFDNVWSVFDGLFCHVALPLPEAKLKKYVHVILSFTERKKKKNPGPLCSCWPPCGPPPHCRLGSSSLSWLRASLHLHSALKWTARTFLVLLHTFNALRTTLKRTFSCPPCFDPYKNTARLFPFKDLLLDSIWGLSLTSVDSEEAFWSVVVVVVARNIWRGGLQYAHLWMMGANAEPLRLGLLALMVEFGISTALWQVTKNKKAYFDVIFQDKRTGWAQGMCVTNKNLLRVIHVSFWWHAVKCHDWPHYSCIATPFDMLIHLRHNCFNRNKFS